MTPNNDRLPGVGITVATLSVIIGWLITSQGAQAFVKTHEVITPPGSMLAFGVLIVLKVMWIVGHKRRMAQCALTRRSTGRAAGGAPLSSNVR